MDDICRLFRPGHCSNCPTSHKHTHTIKAIPSRFQSTRTLDENITDSECLFFSPVKVAFPVQSDWTILGLGSGQLFNIRHQISARKCPQSNGLFSASRCHSAPFSPTTQSATAFHAMLMQFNTRDVQYVNIKASSFPPSERQEVRNE